MVAIIYVLVGWVLFEESLNWSSFDIDMHLQLNLKNLSIFPSKQVISLWKPLEDQMCDKRTQILKTDSQTLQ